MPTTDLSARLVLRKKDTPTPIGHIETNLYKKLQKNEYKRECLSIAEQNDLCSIVENKLDIDMKDLLIPLGLGNGYYFSNMKQRYVIKSFENLFMMLIVLCENDIRVDYGMSLEICNLWNELILNNNVKEFAKVQTNKPSKRLTGISIALTYTLHFKAKTIDKIKNAIVMILNKESKISNYSNHRYSIYEIFVDKMVNNKKFELLFETVDPHKFKKQFYYQGSKHEDLFKGKFKPLFINTFFNGRETKGKLIFSSFENQLSMWFDTMSNYFISGLSLRDTCGLKLVGKNENINSLLEEYFIFLTTQKSNPLPTDLIKEGWWASFVDYVRYTYGYSNFWKIKIKTKS